MTLSLYCRTEIKRSHLSASRTEYFLGRSSRSEISMSGQFDSPVLLTGERVRQGPPRVFIYNSDLGCCFELDLESRVYTAYQFPEIVEPQGLKPDDLLPRKTHVHTQTNDTGDRREILGRMARRVLKRLTPTSAESDIGPGFIETDAWYIDPPAAWQRFRNPRKAGTQSISSLPGHLSTQEGARETGFQVAATVRYRNIFTLKGRRIEHETEQEEQVVELSEDDLDPMLFLPPRGFRRISNRVFLPPPFGLGPLIAWTRFKLVFNR
jgi:hypothetical protein